MDSRASRLLNMTNKGTTIKDPKFSTNSFVQIEYEYEIYDIFNYCFIVVQ